MLGLMQDWPLLVHRALDHAARWHGATEIVRAPSKARSIVPTMRNSTAAPGRWPPPPRSGLASSLARSPPPWLEHWRHLEIWYAVMGQGGIVHTLNPRLFADQLVYIVNHAGDRWIFTDLSFVPLFEETAGQAAVGRRLHRHDRPRPHAGRDHAAQSAVL